jgi:hypothetical protein
LKIRKSLILSGAVTAVALSGLIGLGSVMAGHYGFAGDLVEKVAAKFNLDESAVQAVFDENQTERQAERLQEISDRLQTAVDDGDITTEQKALIETRIQEMQTQRETEREQLRTWANSVGVSLRYAMMGNRFGSDDRLQEAVDDGDITAEQKTQIETKQEEMQTLREQDRDTLRQWADDNDIDTQYLMGLGEQGGHGGGPGGPGGPF